MIRRRSSGLNQVSDNYSMLTLGNYTTILAGLQFCIRVLMLEHTLPLGERSNMCQQEINPLPKFKAARAFWLVEGEPSPFNYIHKLLNYGEAASKGMKTRSRIRWSADNKRLYFDGQGLEIERWQLFVHDLLKLAEEMMANQLLFGKAGELPEMDLNSIIDNPNRRESGHYFALETADAINQCREKMLKRLEKSNMWNKMMISDGIGYFMHCLTLGDSLSFAQVAVDEYEAWDVKFRELLCVLIILTCGQSGRGTEMTSLLYMNTMEAERNILLEDGQFMLVTEYHKSMALMDDLKVHIYCFDIRLYRGSYRIDSVNCLAFI